MSLRLTASCELPFTLMDDAGKPQGLALKGEVRPRKGVRSLSPCPFTLGITTTPIHSSLYPQEHQQSRKYHSTPPREPDACVSHSPHSGYIQLPPFSFQCLDAHSGTVDHAPRMLQANLTSPPLHENKDAQEASVSPFPESSESVAFLPVQDYCRQCKGLARVNRSHLPNRMKTY